MYSKKIIIKLIICILCETFKLKSS